MRSLRVKAMPSARGIISDRNGEPLAVSVPVQAVWADPVQIFKEGGWYSVSAGMLWPMSWVWIAKNYSTV
ncbi:cell division protein FtsI [Photobacterium aphoticum]|uniref:Cell division protein FtsI n=1 Tax=Photobacterium aphoticum TaxID=754436 RepID=A0A090QW36_9GAMM|nr:cell division protein FtsI [Photobacterium aphoticum]